jgi:hypothetical protein
VLRSESSAVGAASVRVLTFNSWVGDARRGFCSRDAERLSWIAKQLRAADVDVLCLQEVLEAEMQQVCVCVWGGGGDSEGLAGLEGNGWRARWEV